MLCAEYSFLHATLISKYIYIPSHCLQPKENRAQHLCKQMKDLQMPQYFSFACARKLPLFSPSSMQSAVFIIIGVQRTEDLTE